MPKLSVLMPVYNSEKYLAEAIESILCQTFSDFEFIVIDDGSTDKSIAIVESYADPRIRFYRNSQNLGISQTLNKGITLATTDYIARMDADDISYPDRLEKQYAYLQQHPDCAMVSSFARVVSEDRQFIRQDKFKSEHYYYNLVFICWIYHPTVLYRKSAVMAVNMYTAPYSEDFELFSQLGRKYKIYNLPEVLLDYRVTDQSLHQVLRKDEYEQAQQQQVLCNIRYYTGSSYHLPDSYLACYRHNFAPLLALNSLSEIVKCIRQLDYITACILRKANANRQAAHIKRAAKYKRSYIIAYFARRLSLSQKLVLVAQVVPVPDMLRYVKRAVAPVFRKPKAPVYG